MISCGESKEKHMEKETDFYVNEEISIMRESCKRAEDEDLFPQNYGGVGKEVLLENAKEFTTIVNKVPISVKKISSYSDALKEYGQNEGYVFGKNGPIVRLFVDDYNYEQFLTDEEFYSFVGTVHFLAWSRKYKSLPDFEEELSIYLEYDGKCSAIVTFYENEGWLFFLQNNEKQDFVTYLTNLVGEETITVEEME